jgi:aspartyl-tRNA(Asn)/glutamyl-tRNA(Gln) amidotransferase subunit A
MSLVIEAERYVANQSAHIALNSFVTPLRRHAGRWHDQAKEADSRRGQGMALARIPVYYLHWLNTKRSMKPQESRSRD